MAAITDLTFEQVANEVATDPNPFFVGADADGNVTVLLSLTVLNGEDVPDLTSTGVVKAMARLHALCAKAQKTLNQNQVPGEKLDAFPVPVTSAQAEEGYIEQAAPIKYRLAIATAEEIYGATDKVVL